MIDLLTTYQYDGLNRLYHVLVTRGSSTHLLEQTYTLRPDGQREAVVEDRGDGAGTVTMPWTYDAAGRLTGEMRDEDGDAAADQGTEYADAYGYDLNGNRVVKAHDGVGTADDASVRSGYDGRDQLTGWWGDVDGNGAWDQGEQYMAGYSYDADGGAKPLPKRWGGGGVRNGRALRPALGGQECPPLRRPDSLRSRQTGMSVPPSEECPPLRRPGALRSRQTGMSVPPQSVLSAEC